LLLLLIPVVAAVAVAVLTVGVLVGHAVDRLLPGVLR
jgi:hypothetical protein